MNEQRNHDQCPQHASLDSRLDKLQATLDAVLSRLGCGDVSLATISVRVRILELIVYGGVALALIAMIGAVIKGTGIAQ